MLYKGTKMFLKNQAFLVFINKLHYLISFNMNNKRKREILNYRIKENSDKIKAFKKYGISDKKAEKFEAFKARNQQRLNDIPE